MLSILHNGPVHAPSKIAFSPRRMRTTSNTGFLRLTPDNFTLHKYIYIYIYILHNGPGYAPQKLPFHLGGSGCNLIQGTLGPPDIPYTSQLAWVCPTKSCPFPTRDPDHPGLTQYRVPSAHPNLHPKYISIGSAVLAQRMVVTNRHAHRHTEIDHSTMSMYVCSNGPHLCTACMRCGLISEHNYFVNARYMLGKVNIYKLCQDNQKSTVN